MKNVKFMKLFFKSYPLKTELMEKKSEGDVFFTNPSHDKLMKKV